MDHTLSIIDYALRRGGRTPETLADINVIAWHWYHDPWEERPDHPVWEMWDAQVGFTFLQTMGECRRIRLKNKVAPDILPTADLEAALERHRQRKKKDSE